jgi:DNA-binding winged-HTH domains
MLVRERHRIVSREEMMDEVWKDVFVEEGNINFHMSSLRKALGQTGDVQFIKTVPKLGYRFVADTVIVEELSGQDQPSQTSQPQVIVGKSLRESRPLFSWAAAALVLLVAGSLVFAGWGFLSSRSVTVGGNEGVAPQNLRGTDSDAAYSHYLRGKQIWEGRVFTDETPLESFRRAVEADPQFASAHLAMADLYATQGSRDLAQRSLNEALRADANVKGAKATEGFILMFLDWDWRSAETAFLAGVAATPDDAKTRHWYGVFLSLHGRFQEAEREMQEALRHDPTSLIIMADSAQLKYFSRDYTRSAAQLEEIFRIDPNFAVARRYMHALEAKRGNERDALDAMINSGVSSADEIAKLSEIFDQKGLAGIWEANLVNGRCDSSQPKSHYYCATNYARLGMTDKAIASLESAAEQRAFLLPFIAVDPIFDGLRDQPRFRSVLDKIGLINKAAA